MSSNNKRNRRRGNRRNQQQNRNDNTPKTAPPPSKPVFVSTAKPADVEREELPDLICETCGNPIRDVHNAISIGEEHKPVHFDCALKQLGENEELADDEKICYLGQGSFGVVLQKPRGELARYTVVRRIQIEEKDKKIPWRKQISSHISKI